jgi:hypothetical protein
MSFRRQFSNRRLENWRSILVDQVEAPHVGKIACRTPPPELSQSKAAISSMISCGLRCVTPSSPFGSLTERSNVSLSMFLKACPNIKTYLPHLIALVVAHPLALHAGLPVGRGDLSSSNARDENRGHSTAVEKELSGLRGRFPVRRGGRAGSIMAQISLDRELAHLYGISRT